MNDESVINGDDFKFTDAKGREWDCRMTLGGAKRIDACDYSEVSEEQFSILRPDQNLFMGILRDAPLLFAIVWQLVKPQAGNYPEFHNPEHVGPPGSSDLIDDQAAENEFIDGLDGETIKTGRQAFWRSLANFFPDHQTVLLTLLTQWEKAHKRVGLRLQGMQTQMTEMFEAEVDKGMDSLQAEFEQTIGNQSE